MAEIVSVPSSYNDHGAAIDAIEADRDRLAQELEASQGREALGYINGIRAALATAEATRAQKLPSAHSADFIIEDIRSLLPAEPAEETP